MRTHLCIALLLSLAAAAKAQLVGTAFTYQGQLTSAGAAASGEYDMRFRLFDSLTGGTQLGPLLTFDGAAGDPADITVANGLFMVNLDFGNQFAGVPVYLQIATRPHGTTGAYTVLAPRQQLTPTPFAMGLSLPIATTVGADSPALAITNTGAGISLVSSAADGLDSTSTALNGNGVLGICSNGAAAYGVWGQSNTGFGVVGSATGTATGGYFYSGSGYGLLAASTSSDATSTTGVGVYGVAHSPSGISGAALLKTGVWGDSDIGNGVVGTTASGSGGSGVLGILNTFTGASLLTNPGVRGDSSDGHGVAGITASTSANVAGVLGYTGSSAAIGVWGDNTGTTGDSLGVVGITHSSTGYAGYFQGRMAATGTKSFRIDHPLDPANKYLIHYCTEGPVPQNVYNGVVTTDASGEAVVTLPAYFQEINSDFRYTLTVIDADDFALVRVSREIAGNTFAIKSSRGNVKVSWEVKAARSDRFVKAYGAPVEQDKPASAKGTYLQPELYGEPESQGLFARPVSNSRPPAP
jgi:hypothetical protein